MPSTKRIAGRLEAEQAEYRHSSRDPVAEQTAKHAKASIERQLADLEAELIRAGCGQKHITTVRAHVLAFKRAAGITALGDITVSRLNKYASELRERGRAARTVNSHIVSIKWLTRWAWSDGRLSADPFAAVRPATKAEAKDRRRIHRTLTSDELTRLVAAAKAGPEFTWTAHGERCAITGIERAVAYRVALGTGLRAGSWPR